MPKIALLAALLLLASNAAISGRPSVSVQGLNEVRTQKHAPLILDVRSEEEFAAGHIPGAVLIPHDQLETRLTELGSPAWIVVYCRSGRRAGLAETILNKHGFEVRQLQGSWQSWEAAGLETTKNP